MLLALRAAPLMLAQEDGTHRDRSPSVVDVSEVERGDHPQSLASDIELRRETANEPSSGWQACTCIWSTCKVRIPATRRLWQRREDAAKSELP